MASHGCAECMQAFTTIKDLQDHAKEQKHQAFRCHYCAKGFRSDSGRWSHQNSHSEEQERRNADQCSNQCPVCNMTFAKRAEQQEHAIVNQHKAFLCEKCRKGFVTGHYVNLHKCEDRRRSNKRGVAPEPERARPAPYSRPPSSQPQSMHHPVPQSPSQQGSSYSVTSSQLPAPSSGLDSPPSQTQNVSYVSVHALNLPNQSTIDNLVGPYNAIIQTQSLPESDGSMGASGPPTLTSTTAEWWLKMAYGPNVCAECKEKFAKLKHLGNHATARGHKSFQCKHCQKGYRTFRAFKIHRCKDPRKMVCAVCKESFATIKELEKHAKEEKHQAFHCKHCQKGYRRNETLERHPCDAQTPYSRPPSFQPQSILSSPVPQTPSQEGSSYSETGSQLSSPPSSLYSPPSQTQTLSLLPSAALNASFLYAAGVVNLANTLSLLNQPQSLPESGGSMSASGPATFTSTTSDWQSSSEPLSNQPQPSQPDGPNDEAPTPPPPSTSTSTSDPALLEQQDGPATSASAVRPQPIPREDFMNLYMIGRGTAEHPQIRPLPPQTENPDDEAPTPSPLLEPAEEPAPRAMLVRPQPIPRDEFMDRYVLGAQAPEQPPNQPPPPAPIDEQPDGPESQ